MQVTVRTIISQPEVVEGAKAFSEKINNAGDDVIAQICADKVEESESWESETWKFISAKFSTDPKRETLKLLGYEPQEDKMPDGADHVNNTESTMNGNEEDFFDTLGAASQVCRRSKALDETVFTPRCRSWHCRGRLPTKCRL